MALYAIGDTHLSLSSDKPMDVFGGGWTGYVEKLREGLGVAPATDRAKGKADAAALAARAVSGEADDQELLDNQPMIPTWRERDYTDVPVGTPYQWQGIIYKLLQAHDATGNPGWTPDTVPALKTLATACCRISRHATKT